MEEKPASSEHTTVIPRQDSTANTQEHSLADLPFAEWSRYQVLDFLGEGATAKVYKAMDPTLNRKVALKFISGGDPSLEKRFIREARAQAQIDHDQICKIYEVGTFSGRHYIAMQFIEGENLEKAAMEMTLEQKCRTMQQVAEAVHGAHRLGIIHRDLKPGNIMVERTETGSRPYVLDFGLAREVAVAGATVTGLVMGTPAYMSPEQAWGDAQTVDRRADLYSLGATFYRILSNRLPFEGNSYEVLMRLYNSDPVPLRKYAPQIPRDVETIVMKCLEKNPQQRYESARALAEDLQRYLNGEPIQARPPSMIYRLTRKAKKHTAIVGSTVAALLVILVLLGLWIESRWKAGQQAALAQQLGEEVQKMEGSLRSMYMLPIHDVRPEKSFIRKQMEEMIQQITKRTGEMGKAPINYSTGRVYLALQDYEKARIHLEAAWKEGYRAPDVAYALGLAWGSIYQHKIQEIDRIEIRGAKESARQDLEEKYRNPALAYLKEASGLKTESSDYVKALIAFYEKKYDEALKNASTAFRQIPWLYEAKILEGDIQVRQAYEREYQGDYEQAKKLFHTSEESYRTAGHIAESDVRTYEGVCTAWNELFYLESITSMKDMQGLLGKAVDSCAQALLADADRAQVYSQIAKTYRVFGGFQADSGQDASETIQKSLDAARRATELDPEDFSSFQILGTAYWQKAKQEMVSGQDPEKSLGLSIQNSKKALQMNPQNISTYNAIGLAYMELGNYQMEFGKHPGPSLNEATAAFQKAIELRPGFINAIANLGACNYVLGRYEMDHGKDPTTTMEKAIAAFNKTRQMSPKLPFSYRFLVNTYRDLVEYRYWLGQNPENEVKKAREFFETGVQLNEAFEYVYTDMAGIYLILSELDLEQNRNPAEDLILAGRFTEKALSINPNSSWNFHSLGEASMIQGRWLLQNKKNPSADLAAARKRAERELEINSQSAGGYVLLAESHLRQAEWELSQNKNSASSLDRALQLLDEAKKIDPTLAEVFAIRGKIYLLQATAIPGSEKYDAAKKAKQSFEETLTMNRNLQRLYSSELEKATKLLSR